MFGPVLLVVLGVLSSPAIILMGKRDLVASLFCGFSSWCCGLVCSMLLWYFLAILTYFFGRTF